MIANTPSTPRPKQVDIEKDFHKDTPGFMRWVQKKVEESAKLHQLTEYEKPGDTYMTNEYLIVLDMGVEHKTKESVTETMSKSSANIPAALEGERRPAVSVNQALVRYNKAVKATQKLFTSLNRCTTIRKIHPNP